MKTTLSGRVAILLALALITSVSGAASAQTNVTSSAEIQRLQDNVYEASRDLTQLRSRDIITELVYVMGEKLDYRLEASNVRRMRKKIGRAHV